MAKNTDLETQKLYVSPEPESSSLKGTLLFVMFVGVFIVGSWSAIFFLYLNRL
jgi:hypothetical protein